MDFMKPLSWMVLLVAFIAIGCAHNSTSTLSIEPRVPSVQPQGVTFAAAEQNPSQSKEAAAEQSPSKVEEIQEEKPPPISEEGTEDLSDEDLDFEEDLDFLEEEPEETKAVLIADPLEPVNRAIFHFNDRLYFWLLKPAARGYNWVFPEDFRVAVRNFFVNLLFPVRFVNCILQGNFRGAGIEVSRFAVNSTLGLFGFFDPSSRGLNLPMQDEDLGQTLGVARMGPGIFINMPILGPYSTRSLIGWVGDSFLDPVTWYVDPLLLRWGVKGYKKFNNVSLTLGDYEALKEAAIDPYIAIRNAYIQYRNALVKERGVFPESVTPAEVYSSKPEVQRASNDYFVAELKPHLKEGQGFFVTFRLVLTNKTQRELNLDWENTFYLLNGRENGRFLWKGVTWDGLKEIRGQPLVPIAAGETLTAIIFPKQLLGRASGAAPRGVQYTQGALPEGENGIGLVVRQNGKVIREKMVVTISK
jgi:phospholipid-binding lipoprotein MlaA